ncbi:DUF3084 domain-containing protein [Leptolyngbya sp. CCY15150]|uniref:DUF3084 domain-containing protein n=1 Tax=Leptolyngbya sp. CCY15150 TaxID=2767772 RepID=UPI001950B3C9|nr:DUF3084 domain-containing protein [Leptolyngbya sp. CCY15150]
MTTGLILITAILILGGVIATLGDRIGMRVGKARLSLFNLRPRQTATVITILTGGVISASTLAILFLISDQLRTGVFELQKIQDDLAMAGEELDETQAEKSRIQDELERSVNEQRQAETRLQDINQSLGDAIARQRLTQQQLERTRNNLDQLETNFRQAQDQLATASQQAEQLQSEIQIIQQERAQLLANRELELAERDAAIAQRDAAIAERETRLSALEEEQAELQLDIAALEREFLGLRQGNVALLRNEPLASSGVRLQNPDLASEAVNRLLNEANRVATRAILPDILAAEQEQVIQITVAQVEQIKEQIQDGREYIVRIFSAGNYVVGEPCVLAGEACVQVYAVAAFNRVIFQQGDVIATVSVNPSELSNVELVEQYELLISASRFQGRQAGILAETITIAGGRSEAAIAFFQQLRQYSVPIEIRAVAASTISTPGPLEIDLVAVRNGQVLFSTATIENTP